jgi:hypothetical protein
MIYYVYILRDPRKENEPFYVGKGKDKRAKSHTNSNNDDNPFKTNVINKIKAAGLEPIIEYHSENLTEGIAFIQEISLIKKYGRRDLGLGPLTNLTDGGEGSSGHIRSEEAQEKWYKSRKASGYKHSIDVIDKIAKSNTGKSRSEETKRKLSESHIGKIQTADSNQKRSIALKGRTIPEEQKLFLSESRMGENNPMFGKESPMKGKTHSEESKNKIKEARSRQIITEETKRKMSEAHKLRHQLRKEKEVI